MKTERIRPLIVLTVACVLTIISAVMNVSGYISLYQQSSIIISMLFISLEVAKATIFGIVFIIGDRTQKIILLLFAVLLVTISFLGHLSFLSRAYNVTKNETRILEESSKIHKDTIEDQIQLIDSQIDNMKTLLDRNNSEYETIKTNIDSYQNANSKNWAYNTNKKRMKEISETNSDINNKLQKLYEQKREIINSKKDYSETNKDITHKIAINSVFDYTSKIFNVTTDTLSTYINIILSIVIDPIALILLWTGNSLMFRKSNSPTVKYEEFTDENESDNFVLDLSIKYSPITIYNCDDYTYKGYTLSDFIKLDVDTINQIRKEANNNKRAREWINSCMSVRHNKNLFHKSKETSKTEIEAEV